MKEKYIFEVLEKSRASFGDKQPIRVGIFTKEDDAYALASFYEDLNAHSFDKSYYVKRVRLFNDKDEVKETLHIVFVFNFKTLELKHTFIDTYPFREKESRVIEGFDKKIHVVRPLIPPFNFNKLKLDAENQAKSLSFQNLSVYI